MSLGKDMAEQFGYSDTVRSGEFVFCSGQVGLDAGGKPPRDPAEQFRLAFDALSRVLAEAGCTPADVVELNSFHTNYPQHMPEFMEAKAVFQQGARPAWTAIGVAALGACPTPWWRSRRSLGCVPAGEGCGVPRAVVAVALLPLAVLAALILRLMLLVIAVMLSRGRQAPARAAERAVRGVRAVSLVLGVVAALWVLLEPTPFDRGLGSAAVLAPLPAFDPPRCVPEVCVTTCHPG